MLPPPPRRRGGAGARGARAAGRGGQRLVDQLSNVRWLLLDDERSGVWIVRPAE